MLEEVPPLGAHEVDGASGCALVDLHDEDAADADAFHCFEVGGDAFACDVAV